MKEHVHKRSDDEVVKDTSLPLHQAETPESLSLILMLIMFKSSRSIVNLISCGMCKLFHCICDSS